MLNLLFLLVILIMLGLIIFNFINKTYKFRLEDNFITDDLGIYPKYEINLCSKKFFCATIHTNGTITIYKNYSWNGCSPLINFFDLFFIKTPDGIVDIKNMKPKVYYASCVHDLLYQFKTISKETYSRKQADEAFLKYMKKTNFSLRYVYYIAVRLFGWMA